MDDSIIPECPSRNGQESQLFSFGEHLLRKLGECHHRNQENCKFGNDAGSKPMDDSILPKYPKVNGQERHLFNMENTSLSILANAILEVRKLSKLAMMPGLNPFMIRSILSTQAGTARCAARMTFRVWGLSSRSRLQSFLSAPKKGNDQKRCLIDIGERLLPNVGKNRVRKVEKCQNLAMTPG